MRRTLQDFLDMGAKLEAGISRLLQTSNLAPLITESSINGTERDGWMFYVDRRMVPG